MPDFTPGYLIPLRFVRAPNPSLRDCAGNLTGQQVCATHQVFKRREAVVPLLPSPQPFPSIPLQQSVFEPPAQYAILRNQRESNGS